jgi:putative DNA primase/helicase
VNVYEPRDRDPEAEAIPFGTPAEDSEPIRIVPSPEDPMGVAHLFLNDTYTREEELLLRHHRGSFHRWTGASWPEDEDRRIKSELYHWLEPAVYSKATRDGSELVPFRPNAKKVSEVAQALAAIGHVPEALDRPCWLDGSEVDDVVVAMANGLLHLSTRTVEPHRPAYFNEQALPFNFDSAAPTPLRRLRFLEELWGDDQSRSTASPRPWVTYSAGRRTSRRSSCWSARPVRGRARSDGS